MWISFYLDLILDMTQPANDKIPFFCSVLAIPASSPHTSLHVRMVASVLRRKKSYYVINYSFKANYALCRSVQAVVCCIAGDFENLSLTIAKRYQIQEYADGQEKKNNPFSQSFFFR